MLKLFRRLKRERNLYLALVYAWRYVTSRGPSAIRRRLRARQDVIAIKRSMAATRGVRLGMLVTGGVGDHIVAARFMRDLRSVDESLAFDIFSPNPPVARWIFASLPGFKNCALDASFESLQSQYDITMGLSPIITVKSHGQGARTPPVTAALQKCVECINSFERDAEYCLGKSTRMHGHLAQQLVFQNMTRSTCAHNISGIKYGGDAFPLFADETLVAAHGLHHKPYVTVHNGFEAQYITSSGRSTKCYPHFNQVIALLKQRFPQFRFVQIGSATSTSLGEADLDLIGQTTLSQASALIRGAVAHLDNESGLVHIASCYSVRCCVVFGPTPPDYFGYTANENIRPKICGSCWWTTDDWMDRCPRGFGEPICTFTQPPCEVAEAMGRLLQETFKPEREQARRAPHVIQAQADRSVNQSATIA
jgi:hypothetical protein